jgi:ATP-binding cassette subfamily B protein
MAEYFDVEEVVKEYDSRITKRILSYLRPYKGLVIVALIALIVSTAGELYVPVLIRNIIDNVILVNYVVMDETVLSKPSLDLRDHTKKLVLQLEKDPTVVHLGNRYFLNRAQTTRLSGLPEKELKERGVLLPDQWYLFRYRTGSPVEKIMDARSSLFVTETTDGSRWGAIRNQDLYGLPIQDIRTIRRDDFSQILQAAVAFLFALLLILGATFAQTWVTSLMGQKIMKDIRLELYRKTVNQASSFISRHPVGRMVTRLTGDVETINEFFTSVLSAFLKDFSIMVGVFITLFILAPTLALVVSSVLPFVFVISAYSRIRARDAFRRQRIASSRVNSFLSERLSGMQVVQLFTQEKRSGVEFAQRSNELLSANLGEMFVVATFRPLIDFLSFFTIALVITVGGAMVLGLSLSLGMLIAFINLIQMFFSPVQDIAEKYTVLQSAMAGGERVFALLDTDEAIPDTGKESVEGRVRGRVEFDHVSFAYKKGEPVLKDVTFTVEPAEMVAIVGYTGAGKTTITQVLTRLWDIQSGFIRLDGIPIQELPLGELRRSVLPVLQEVFLFSLTVADNIRLGLPLSDEEVEKAARAVHAHDFISKLPQGYQTVLSEGATNISSGQRQLISFARVIAHNPAIVVLDEATSSIDTETEHLIQLGMERLLAGRTSIVIAHRLSTIRHAKRILVLSGGRLVEQGTHQELIQRQGLYASLYRLQYESHA